MFDPKTNKFPYPEDTGVHYLNVKKDNGNIYDENYPYIDKSLKFRFKQFWFRFFFKIVASPVSQIRTKLRVVGKENLKKNKDVIKNGVVSVSNHIHMWDYMCIYRKIFKYKPNILAWDKNISGENGKMIRMVGGVPVPSNSKKGFLTMAMSLIKEIQHGGWLHVMAEGTMWEYYGPIRPFKEGPAYFAVKSNRPIIPMAYTFRPAKGIRKHIFKQIAYLTLNIGEPIYPDTSISKDEAIKKLTIESHKAVCKLAGFKEGENIYPPVYNDENKKRIDYYTNQYGVGYKGSW